MQNHLEIWSKNQFWTRNVRNWTKSRDLVMSGPVQEDKYLLQTSGNNFIFSDFTPFHFYQQIYCSLNSSVLLSKVIIFIKSSVLLSKFISLQVLIAKPRFLLLQFQGLQFLYFIINFMFFIKMINF